MKPCPQCAGAGKVRAQFSKNAKKLLKLEHREKIVHDDVREIACPVCQGKGTVK